MKTGKRRKCPWCRRWNTITGPYQKCKTCGHCANVSKRGCDCRRCQFLDMTPTPGMQQELFPPAELRPPRGS